MEHSSPDMTVEQICTVIDLLNPCIDDHLYVYDFTNDYYYISTHAAELLFTMSLKITGILSMPLTLRHCRPI